MNIAQVMKFDVETCHIDDNLNTIAGKMSKIDIGCLPFVNASLQVLGMITERDICIGAYNQQKALSDIPVSAVMSRDLFSCHATDTVAKVEASMRRHKVRRLPVVNTEGKLVGIVSLDDLAVEAERKLGSRNHDITAQEVIATLASVHHPSKRNE